MSEIVSNGTNSFQNQRIYLENDINMGGQQVNAIGNDIHPFQGVFFGNRHTISNLTLGYTTQGKRGVGLFGYLDSKGCIRNLFLENVKTPTNCDTNCLGTVVARNHGLITEIGVKSGNLNAMNKSWPNDDKWYTITVGGIVGRNDGQIETSYNKANLTIGSTENANFGGICGRSADSALVKYCYNRGNLNLSTKISRICMWWRYIRISWYIN